MTGMGENVAQYLATLDAYDACDAAEEARPSPDEPPSVGKTSANARQVGGGHYTAMGVEPWDVVDTWPLEQQIGYYRGGALKYIMRMGTKDGRLQEARKGLHYQEKLVEVLTQAEEGEAPRIWD